MYCCNLVVYVTMLVNAPRGELCFCRRRTMPRAVYYVAGAYFDLLFRTFFAPRGDTEKQEALHTSRTQQHHSSSSRCWVMSQRSSTDKAPNADKNTGDHSKSWENLAVVLSGHHEASPLSSRTHQHELVPYTLHTRTHEQHGTRPSGWVTINFKRQNV